MALGSDMAQTSETTNRWLAQAVGRHCRQNAANIYMASFFLPPRKRLALQAVGSFLHLLREALDVAPAAGGGGGCASGGELEARLTLVVDRLEVMYAGQICPPEIGARPEDAVIAAASAAIARYEIPKQWFSDLLAGLKTRATKLRYATWISLEKNLRETGGSSALIISAILGVTSSDVHEHALNMGTAIELTCLLRDLKNDAQNNRILLPLEDLIRFRYSEKDLLAGVVNDNFIQLIKFQLERARNLYRNGAAAIPWLGGDGSRLCAATLAVLYSGLLRLIERKNFDVFTKQLKLTTPQRARRMVDAFRLARNAKIAGWERR
jgi:15-cis-phytoene synthase